MLLVSTVVPLLTVVIFYVLKIVHGALCIFLGQCFGRPYRVSWWHIALMKLSEVWRRRKWIIYHDMGCLLKELLMIGFIGRVMMYWLEGCCCSSLSISMVMKSNNCWSIYLSDVSNFNFMPVSVVICTHTRALVIIFLN